MQGASFDGCWPEFGIRVFRIIKLLQKGDNGGLCPFLWQEFTVFARRDMAGSCQTVKLFVLNS
jgi:hypothetical protein